MKKFLFYFFCLLSVTSFSQEKLVIEGTNPNFYFAHVTAAKETLFSLSRSYNQTPASIATLNGLANDAQLHVGQQIKIPVSKNNFTQDGQKASDETLIPLYHIVQPKQTLFGISRMYNNVSIDFIREWNNITKDVIKLNQYLIIGHLKIKNNGVSSNSAVASVSTVPEKQYDIPVAKKIETTNPPVKDEPKVVEDKKSTTVVSQPVVNVSQKEETEKVPVKSIHVGDKGFFASLYANGKNEVSGDAAIFKTTSGWTDGKFYVLMNNADAGTVVKVSANNKVIYAKVLGPLPDVKEDNGLMIRISTAGVAALGIADTKFFVSVNY